MFSFKLPLTMSPYLTKVVKKEQEHTASGLNLFIWTLKRSGSLVTGGDRYDQTIKEIANYDGDMPTTLDVLIKDAGIESASSLTGQPR